MTILRASPHAADPGRWVAAGEVGCCVSMWQSSSVQHIWFVMHSINSSLIYLSIYVSIHLSRVPFVLIRVTCINERCKKKSQKREHFTRKIKAFPKECMSKSTRRIDPKSIQNCAREVSGWHPGTLWSLPEAGPGWFADATENLLKIKGFWEAPGTSRDAQMDPEGAQKSIENLLFGEKERSKRGFFVDFCAQCRFPWFFRDLSSIFHEKLMKHQLKSMCIFS